MIRQDDFQIILKKKSRLHPLPKSNVVVIHIVFTSWPGDYR